MDIVRRNPRRGLRDLSAELDRFFMNPWLDNGRDTSMVETSQWAPAVDIRELDDKFIVEADIPGVKPEDIEVTLEKGVLSIRGERRSESETTEEGVRRIERAHGVFYRRFALPDTADPDAVSARGEQGVLRIEIGKSEGARSRRIPVER